MQQHVAQTGGGVRPGSTNRRRLATQQQQQQQQSQEACGPHVLVTMQGRPLVRLSYAAVHATMPDSLLPSLLEMGVDTRLELAELSPVPVAPEDEAAVSRLLLEPGSAEAITTAGAARFALAWLLPSAPALVVMMPLAAPILVSTEQLRALRDALKPYRRVYHSLQPGVVLQVPARAKNVGSPRVRAALQRVLQDGDVAALVLAEAHALGQLRPEAVALLLAPHNPPPAFRPDSALVQRGESRPFAAALRSHVFGPMVLGPGWPPGMTAPTPLELTQAFKLFCAHVLGGPRSPLPPPLSTM